MGAKAKDEVGNRYGRLTVLKRIPEITKAVFWLCLCDCGKETQARSTNLRGGTKLSCGCFGNEIRKEARLKKITTHGMYHTSEYKTWECIKQRCTNPNAPTYKYYGGRGIKLCDKWQSFQGFIEDMGTKPDNTYHIHRINKNEGYLKENCIWMNKIDHARLHGLTPNDGQFKKGLK